MSDLELNLSLRYRHDLGEMRPYFEGLTQGKAIASKCPDCDQCWFPPKLTCCGNGPVRWVELPGTGVVHAVTSGSIAVPFSQASSAEFAALIQMTGASNQVLGLLYEFDAEPPPGTRVVLRAAPDAVPHPSQAARFVPAG